jgi:hypothetical protein
MYVYCVFLLRLRVLGPVIGGPTVAEFFNLINDFAALNSADV